ncbi:MAG: ABC transporter permease [Candidatus Delongbacteria bacterium]|nr:ABC transporter permease [Candidatus Delongbacteria bacterium]MBN2835662.1 ABC transporter permease [Candidatus Delongbacteria bacterium]
MTKIKLIIELYLKEIFRNRFLVVTSLIIPLIVYPLFYFFITQVIMIHKGIEDNQNYTYSVNSNNYENEIIDSLNNIKGLKYDSSSNLVIKVDFNENLPKFFINLDSTNNKAKYFADKISVKLQSFYDSKVSEITKVENPKSFSNMEIKRENIFDEHELPRRMLSLILPFFIIIMISSGAGAVAVEITSGERENKCSETIFTSAVTRREIYYGKLLSASIFTMLSGFLNIIIIVIIGFLALSTFIPGKFGDVFGILNTILTVDIIIVTLMSFVLLSVMTSLLFISITSFSKTKKEAGVTLTPAILVITYSSIIVMLPAFEPNLAIALVPILNLSFLMKTLIAQDYNMMFIVTSIIASIIEFVLLIKFSLPLLEDENIIFGTSESTFYKKIKSGLKWKKQLK